MSATPERPKRRRFFLLSLFSAIPVARVRANATEQQGAHGRRKYRKAQPCAEGQTRQPSRTYRGAGLSAEVSATSPQL